MEDESIVALDIRLQLEALGHDVVATFDRGEDLLDNLAELNPDLVMLDVLLKGELDGIQTADLIKERAFVPVILLTALDTQDILDRAKLAQPFAFIVKPFDEIELRNTVVISLYRHELEKSLRQRERLFSTTLASIQDGVLVTDNEFCVEYSNAVAQTVTGMSRDDLHGKDLRSLVTFRTADGDTVGLTEAASSSLEIGRSDGTVSIVERFVAPLASENGGASGWVVVIHDVTERVRQEEQLRRSQKMEAIGRLTGGIAHDFNNLLTVILGYAKLLGEELTADRFRSESDAESLRSDVDGIRKAALRSASLTRQLLAFSRHQIMERRIVDVNTIISDMEKMLERLVTEEVRILVDLGAEQSPVRADPSQIEQVIMNLAVNARDAMPHGGRLSIRTALERVRAEDARPEAREGQYVVLTVRDTGVGMSPGIIDKVFEPFFTTKPIGQGTGLGLSTVYGIVSQSGGFIDIKSAPGQGTSFVVYLPLYEGAPIDAGDAEDLSSVDSGSETILLVEDDDDIRVLLARILRQKHYVVMEAANAGEAILISERTPDKIDLLITDVVMPHLSGIDLGARIQRERPETRILYVSAYPQGYLSEEERARLSTNFMQKPVEPARLAMRVRAILDE